MDAEYVKKWGPTHLTTDIVTVIASGEDLYLVGVRRSSAPSEYALPGGFVDHGETRNQGAIRELLEETGIDASIDAYRPYLNVRRFSQLFEDDTPGRDPRARMMTTVYGCVAKPSTPLSKGLISMALNTAFTDKEIEEVVLFDLRLNEQDEYAGMWRYDHYKLLTRALPMVSLL